MILQLLNFTLSYATSLAQLEFTKTTYSELYCCRYYIVTEIFKNGKEIRISLKDVLNSRLSCFFPGAVRVLLLPWNNDKKTYEDNLIVSQPVDVVSQVGGELFPECCYTTDLRTKVSKKLLGIDDSSNVKHCLEDFYKLEKFKISYLEQCFPPDFNSGDKSEDAIWEEIYQHVMSKELFKFATYIRRLPSDSEKMEAFIKGFIYCLCFPFKHTQFNVKHLFTILTKTDGSRIDINPKDLFFIEFNLIAWDEKKIESGKYTSKYEKFITKIFKWEGNGNPILSSAEERKILKDVVKKA